MLYALTSILVSCSTGNAPSSLDVASASDSRDGDVAATNHTPIDTSIPILAFPGRKSKTIVIHTKSYIKFPNGNVWLVGAGATITNGIVHYGAGSTLPNGMRIGGIAAESQEDTLKKFTPPPMPSKPQ